MEKLNCFRCGTTKNIIDHHTSYFPEKKRPCYRSCHQKIHVRNPKLSETEMQVSITASRVKTQNKLKPIDFNINEVREAINNLY